MENCLYYRGFLKTTVIYHGLPITIINTHLVHSFSDEIQACARQKQAQEIVDHVSELPNDEIIIVGGDLNAGKGPSKLFEPSSLIMIITLFIITVNGDVKTPLQVFKANGYTDAQSQCINTTRCSGEKYTWNIEGNSYRRSFLGGPRLLDYILYKLPIGTSSSGILFEIKTVNRQTSISLSDHEAIFMRLEIN